MNYHVSNLARTKHDKTVKKCEEKEDLKYYKIRVEELEDKVSNLSKQLQEWTGIQPLSDRSDLSRVKELSKSCK